jgi:DNA invertase Pin-like site-specific DNA recombinase
MMKAVNAKEFDMVATWSVDRFGRSLSDLLGILQVLHEKGGGLFLHQQGLDSSTTAGKAMFQMLGVFAELSGALSERGSMPVWRAPGRMGQSSAGVGLTQLWKREFSN